jgi:CDP-diacylglycerol--glycerol-3-phosphate 3-phosphatidyltransferase
LTLANKLTWGRIAAIPLIAAGIVMYRPGETEWLRYAVIALFCAAILTDALDGAVARGLNQRTKLGAFLDPLADKLLINVAFIFMAVQDGFTAAIPRWVPPVILARDMLIVVGARIAIGVSDLRVFKPRVLGKITTTLQMAALLAALLRIPFAHKLTLAAVALTVVSCVDYLWSGGRLAWARKRSR